MKKRAGTLFLLLLLILQLVAAVSFWRPGIPEGHDTVNHVARIASYEQALTDGQIPPRWAGALNYTYGTPVFTFFYPLPYMAASLFFPLHLPYETIWKIISVSAFIAAGFGFYIWMREITDDAHAFLAALIYSLSPYHLLNLLVRGDIGELFAYVCIPLVGWSYERIVKKRKAGIAALSLSYGLLILAHHGVALVATPVLIVYFLARNSGKNVLRTISGLGLGLMLSLFFWLPALFETRYLNTALSAGSMYQQQFVPFLDLFRFRWGFADSLSGAGALSPQIGLFQLTVALVALILFFRTKRKSALSAVWLIIFFSAAYMTTEYAAPVWQVVPLLSKLQFPWRLIGFTALAAGWLVRDIPFSGRSSVIAAVLLITLTLPFVGVRGYIHHPDAYYRTFSGSTYYHGEATPVWTAGDPSHPPKQPIQVIAGSAAISGLTKKTNLHRFTVRTDGTATIADNTLYYPGWTVRVNGKQVPIQFQDPNHRGIITFTVNGSSDVSIRFAETRLRVIADIVSLIAWAGMVLWSIVLYASHRNRR